MDAFLGEVRAFGFGLIPRGWQPCNGQLLSLNSNQALFSLLSNRYGGDGVSTFGLPDLRGRAVLGFNGVFPLGQSSGTDTVSLISDQMPAHNHPAFGSTTVVSTGTPGAAVMLGTFSSTQNYAAAASAAPLNNAALTNSGAGQGHENRQPLLALNVCICTQGVFPSR